MFATGGGGYTPPPPKMTGLRSWVKYCAADCSWPEELWRSRQRQNTHTEENILSHHQSDLQTLSLNWLTYYRFQLRGDLFFGYIFWPATDRGALSPLSFFRDISQSYKRIITKFSILSKPSIWHILTKGKLDTLNRSTTNDVRVTPCFPSFRQK